MKYTLWYAIIFALVASFGIGYLIGGRGATDQTGNRYWKAVSDGMPSALRQKTLDPSMYWQVWSEINDKSIYQPVDPVASVYGSLKGMVAALKDPYSVYFDPTETKQFNAEVSGQFEGIGAELGTKEGTIVIISPLPGSPAEAAGIKAGDQILQIDTTVTTGMSVDQAVGLIRGAKGTSVKLLIMRAGLTEPATYTITRDTISPSSVTWKILPSKVAVISISTFSTDTGSQFDKAVTELLVQNPKGWVIDLRGNPGGYVDTAIDLVGECVGPEIAVIEESTGGKSVTYKAKGSGRLKGLSLAVLVNGGSASASEILAGSLQDYGAAKIIGTKTFGKGVVQTYQEFSDGSSLKLTTARWLTPKGRSINEQGITPDLVVEYTAEDAKAGRDPQLDAAVAQFQSQP